MERKGEHAEPCPHSEALHYALLVEHESVQRVSAKVPFHDVQRAERTSAIIRSVAAFELREPGLTDGRAREMAERAIGIADAACTFAAPPALLATVALALAVKAETSELVPPLLEPERPLIETRGHTSYCNETKPGTHQPCAPQ